MGSRLMVIVDPEDFNNRAWVDRATSHHKTVLMGRGWKPLADLGSESRKSIAKYFKCSSSVDALEDRLWVVAQPKSK